MILLLFKAFTLHYHIIFSSIFPTPHLVVTTTMTLFNKNAKSLIKLISIICFLQIITDLNGQLEVGFYSESCHNVESIVNSVVREASQKEPRMPAILLRLHFHDCFVQVLSVSLFKELLFSMPILFNSKFKLIFCSDGLDKIFSFKLVFAVELDLNIISFMI